MFRHPAQSSLHATLVHACTLEKHLPGALHEPERPKQHRNPNRASSHNPEPCLNSAEASVRAIKVSYRRKCDNTAQGVDLAGDVLLFCSLFTYTSALLPTLIGAQRLEPFEATVILNLLCVEPRILCRYEDMDELEDAMGSSFADFIVKFPILELKTDEKVTGGKVFRVLPPSQFVLQT